MTDQNGEPKKRYTLKELALRAAGKDAWACRICGCRDWRVVNSHLREAGRVRQRVCRHCGEPLHTIEVPIDD